MNLVSSDDSKWFKAVQLHDHVQMGKVKISSKAGIGVNVVYEAIVTRTGPLSLLHSIDCLKCIMMGVKSYCNRSHTSLKSTCSCCYSGPTAKPRWELSMLKPRFRNKLCAYWNGLQVKQIDDGLELSTFRLGKQPSLTQVPEGSFRGATLNFVHFKSFYYQAT